MLVRKCKNICFKASEKKTVKKEKEKLTPIYFILITDFNILKKKKNNKNYIMIKATLSQKN